MTSLTLDNPTLLVLTPLSGFSTPVLTAYSARNLTQSLEPNTGSGGSEGVLIRETVNGETLNLIPDWMRKYRSTISCTDTESPCLDGAWLGVTCEVQCVNELSYPEGGAAQRPAVSGSERVYNHIVYYRPILVMMITAIRNNLAEYNASVQWQIDLREVRNPLLSP